jgi:hypothetical protein
MDPANCLQDEVGIYKMVMFHQMKKTGVWLGENLQSAHKWRNEMSAMCLCFGVSPCKTVSWRIKAHALQAMQAQRGLGQLRLLDFLTSVLYGGRLSASRTGRLYPQGHPWYSFSWEAESTPGPWFSQKEIWHWKIQWHDRESIPGPSY